MFNIKIFSYRQLKDEEKRINEFLESINDNLIDITFSHDDIFHNCIIIYHKEK